MLNYTIAIEDDKQGEARVLFPAAEEDLQAPEEFQERLEWIRQSCQRLLQSIERRSEILERFELN